MSCQALGRSNCRFWSWLKVFWIGLTSKELRFRVFLTFDAMVEEHGSRVASLKRYLAGKHFKRACSRFQLRILKENDLAELEHDEIITLPPFAA